ncbi:MULTISPECIES: Asp/Glu racemase [unclassified Roseovarius]|uniref:maleate cis-trans isomerase family protein n=1 Tax=unclassified Roseovarius TaxID=2614913 RepID=UPI00273F8C20|nr:MULTISPECIES: Asp/Glu racemase [unclassified Roseovarius]
MTSRGRAKVGVLVPFTNTNLEPDMMALAPPGVSLHFSRIGGYDADEIPDEDQMAGLGAANMDEPLRLLQGIGPDVILYGCTSATLSHGPAFDRDLATRIRSQSGAKTVTAAGALLAALGALGVRRIGFASPYVPSLNDRAIAFLADEGVEAVSRADVQGVLDNSGQGALTPDAVFELGLRADSPEAEAIVLSCTDMRGVEAIAKLEKAVGKPVVTSNQAMMFQTLQALGIADVPTGYGCLFEGVAS